MTISEFKDFRSELVNYEYEDKSLRKQKDKQLGGLRTIIPNNERARKYWKLRNATRNMNRMLANISETVSVYSLGGLTLAEISILSTESERMICKWMREFECLKYLA